MTGRRRRTLIALVALPLLLRHRRTRSAGTEIGARLNKLVNERFAATRMSRFDNRRCRGRIRSVVLFAQREIALVPFADAEASQMPGAAKAPEAVAGQTGRAWAQAPWPSQQSGSAGSDCAPTISIG